MVLKRIVFVTLLLFAFIAFMQPCSALTYSGGGEWNYSKELTIKENSGTSLVNYQIPVVLDSSNFDFSLAQPEGEDLRFTSGTKQLQHWVEEWNTARKEALIWVEVPSIPANSSTKITMYYGNPSASDLSSGSGTFEFYDDFSGGVFSNWETFTNGGSEIKVSAGLCNLIVPKFHPEDVATIKSKDEFPVNSMFVVKRKKTTTGTDARGPIMMQGFVDPQKETKNQILATSELQNETDVTWVLKNSKSDVRYYPKDLTDISEIEGDWYTIGVAWYMANEDFAKISMFKDHVKDPKMDLEATEENNYISIEDMNVYFYTGTYSDTSDNTGYSSLDYAYVRKYVADEPTVTFSGSVTSEETTTTAVEETRINITPASGLMTAIRIFDIEDYDEEKIIDLKESGLNTVMLLTTEDDIWNLEKFVKTAHDNDMQVYAMIFNDPNSDTDEDNAAYITNVLEQVIDYNSKSLSAFDGVNIALDPCSEDLGDACTLNLLLLDKVREMTGNDLALAVDVPSSFALSDISNVSESADLIILQTYALNESYPSTKADVVDSVASRMGEIRASDGKALIGLAVNESFMTDSDVQNLLQELEDYYAEDNAFLGTSLVVYEDYAAYTPVNATEEEAEEPAESTGIPGFTGLFAVAGLLIVAFRQKH